MNLRELSRAGACACVLAAASASATTYTITATENPRGFGCSTVARIETCDKFQLETPFPTLSAGDTYKVNLTYSTPLFVPTSKTENVVFVGLIQDDAGVFSVPGYDSNVSTTLAGYVGPPISEGFSAYSSSTYGADAGFGFGSGGLPNSGFTLTGEDLTLDITQSDPNIIVGFIYGYQVAIPEPATWALLLTGFGALGAVVRRRRTALRIA